MYWKNKNVNLNLYVSDCKINPILMRFVCHWGSKWYNTFPNSSFDQITEFEVNLGNHIHMKSLSPPNDLHVRVPCKDKLPRWLVIRWWSPTWIIPRLHIIGLLSANLTCFLSIQGTFMYTAAHCRDSSQPPLSDSRNSLPQPNEKQAETGVKSWYCPYMKGNCSRMRGHYVPEDHFVCLGLRLSIERMLHLCKLLIIKALLVLNGYNFLFFFTWKKIIKIIFTFLMKESLLQNHTSNIKSFFSGENLYRCLRWWNTANLSQSVDGPFSFCSHHP